MARIDYCPAGEIFLTFTRQTPLKAAIDHLWYNSEIMGLISATLSGISCHQDDQAVQVPALGH
jgi:hypothetical protein